MSCDGTCVRVIFDDEMERAVLYSEVCPPGTAYVAGGMDDERVIIITPVGSFFNRTDRVHTATRPSSVKASAPSTLDEGGG